MSLPPGAVTETVHLLGVSIPRSGHHLLARLVVAALGQEARHCEFYTEPGCCGQAPCQRVDGRRVVFQKSHDFDLTLPKDRSDAWHVVQYREPVSGALSDRELHAEVYGKAAADDRGEYAVWLGRKAEYVEGFFRRWVFDPPPASLLLDYDSLTRMPGETLFYLLTTVGLTASAETVTRAVEETIPYGGHTGDRPYQPRTIAASEYFDEELLPAFESLLIDRLPDLAERRVLPPADYSGTVTFAVYLSRRARRRGDMSQSMAHVDRALSQDPSNGLLYHERGELSSALGDHPAALQDFQTADDLRPGHAMILDAVAQSAIRVGSFEVAIGAASAVANQIPDDARHWIRVAELQLARERPDEADAALERAEAAGPVGAHDWHTMARCWSATGHVERALDAVDRALAWAPGTAAYHHQRGELLLDAGRPAEAVGELASALRQHRDDPRWFIALIRAQRAAAGPSSALGLSAASRSTYPGTAS